MKENAGFWLFGLGSSGISDVPPPPPPSPAVVPGKPVRKRPAAKPKVS